MYRRRRHWIHLIYLIFVCVPGHICIQIYCFSYTGKTKNSSQKMLFEEKQNRFSSVGNACEFFKSTNTHTAHPNWVEECKRKLLAATFHVFSYFIRNRVFFYWPTGWPLTPQRSLANVIYEHSISMEIYLEISGFYGTIRVDDGVCGVRCAYRLLLNDLNESWVEKDQKKRRDPIRAIWWAAQYWLIDP